ncbi:MAG: substrate-binding domain-containing protein [Eubacteriales bacterium]|nr:substrate-binding domain-containing protein [Eubacteriales bacterium]
MDYPGIKVYVEPSYAPTPWWKDTMSGLEAELLHNRLSPLFEYGSPENNLSSSATSGTTAAKAATFGAAAATVADASASNIDEVSSSGQKIRPSHETSISIVVGVTAGWMSKATETLQLRGARVVLASSEPVNPTGLISNVTLNRRYSTSDLARYLISCGRSRIAFIGMDPCSSADIHRYEGLFGTMRHFGLYLSDDDIYACTSSVKSCVECFASEMKGKNYNALMCNNDLFAVYFMYKARELGIRIPEDIYLTGFGNTFLGRCSSPSLTTSTLNFNELGKQAAKTAAFLIKNPMILSSATTLASNIIVRGSTENKPAYLPADKAPGSGSPYYINLMEKAPALFRNAKSASGRSRDSASSFSCREGKCITEESYGPYKDKTGNSVFSADYEMMQIFALENFLMNSDEIDLKIISVLSTDLSYPRIAEALYISDSTLRYHIGHIYSALGINSRSEFEELVSRYLPDPSMPLAVAKQKLSGE